MSSEFEYLYIYLVAIELAKEFRWTKAQKHNYISEQKRIHDFMKSIKKAQAHS